MKSTKRVFIIGILLFAAISMSWASGIFSAGSLEQFEQEFGRVESLSLSSGSISIDVLQTNRNYRIDAQLDSRRNVKVNERNGRIDIEVTRPTGPFSVARNESIALYLPHGVELEIDSGSGKVNVSGLDTDELIVEVGSGKVEVDTSDGPMDLSTGSGAIVVKASDGEKRLSTGSGSITVSDSEGAIQANSGSGAHSYQNVKGDISAKGNSGSMRLADVQGVLEISASSGSIRGTQIRLTDDSTFRTGSGRIDVTLTNEKDDLSFDLDAGSGSLRVDESRGSDSLTTGTGKILVTGRSGSGAQEYRTK